MQKFRFLEWQIYKDSKSLFRDIFTVVEQMPQKHRFELGGQLIRSAHSVALNIAEGSGKISDRELNRFLDISLGSLYETLANLDLLKDNGLVSEVQFNTCKT